MTLALWERLGPPRSEVGAPFPPKLQGILGSAPRAGERHRRMPPQKASKDMSVLECFVFRRSQLFRVLGFPSLFTASKVLAPVVHHVVRGANELNTCWPWDHDAM